MSDSLLANLRLTHCACQCFVSTDLQTVSEPVNQIAVQLAVTVAKAARYDVPKEWPELLPALSNAVQSTNDTVQHRGLLFLHHTIKVLASKYFKSPSLDREGFLKLRG